MRAAVGSAEKPCATRSGTSLSAMLAACAWPVSSIVLRTAASGTARISTRAISGTLRQCELCAFSTARSSDDHVSKMNGPVPMNSSTMPSGPNSSNTFLLWTPMLCQYGLRLRLRTPTSQRLTCMRTLLGSMTSNSFAMARKSPAWS